MLHNFPIQSGNEISDRFLQADIRDFSSALIYIQDLPYRRNTLREKSTVVLDEKCGTCSTKHAVLKRLADENGKEVKLMMGIYRMNATNSKSVQPVLEKYKLDFIPEAHNYLRMGGKVIDVTKRSFANTLFLLDLMEEEEITPAQIGNYKIDKHQAFLKTWLEQNPHIHYSFHQLWAIREECIAALSHK
jgi:hypothetical protein